MKKSSITAPANTHDTTQSNMSHGKLMELSAHMHLLIKYKKFETLSSKLQELKLLKGLNKITPMQLINLFAYRNTHGETVFHCISSMTPLAVIDLTLNLLDDPTLRALCQKQTEYLALPIHLLSFNPHLKNQARLAAQLIALNEKYHLATYTPNDDPLDTPLNCLTLMRRYPKEKLEDDAFVEDLQIAWRALCAARMHIRYSDTHTSINHLPVADQIKSKVNLKSMRMIMDTMEESITALNLAKNEKTFLTLMSHSQVTKRFKTGNCEEYAYFVAHELIKLGCNQSIELLAINPGDHIFVVMGRDKHSDVSDIRTWQNGFIIDAWANQIYTPDEWEHYLQDFNIYTRLQDQTSVCVTIPFDITNNKLKCILSINPTAYRNYVERPSPVPVIFTHDWSYQMHKRDMLLLEKYETQAEHYLRRRPHLLGITTPIDCIEFDAQPESLEMEMSIHTNNTVVIQYLNASTFVEYALLDNTRAEFEYLRPAMLALLVSDPEFYGLAIQEHQCKMTLNRLTVVIEINTATTDSKSTLLILRTLKFENFKKRAIAQLEKNFLTYYLDATAFLQQCPQFKKASLKLACMEGKYYAQLNNTTRIPIPYSRLKDYAQFLTIQKSNRNKFFLKLHEEVLQDYLLTLGDKSKGIVLHEQRLYLPDKQGNYAPVSLKAVEDICDERIQACDMQLRNAYSLDNNHLCFNQKIFSDFFVKMLAIFLHQHPDVHRIELNGTKITPAQLREFACVTSLHQLDLNDVSINDEHVAILTQQQHLTHLSLKKCDMSTANATILAQRMWQLKSLDLRDNTQIDATFIDNDSLAMNKSYIQVGTTPTAKNDSAPTWQLPLIINNYPDTLFNKTQNQEEDEERSLQEKLARKSEL